MCKWFDRRNSEKNQTAGGVGRASAASAAAGPLFGRGVRIIHSRVAQADRTFHRRDETVWRRPERADRVARPSLWANFSEEAEFQFPTARGTAADQRPLTGSSAPQQFSIGAVSFGLFRRLLDRILVRRA